MTLRITGPIFGLMNFRAINLSDQWPFGLLTIRTNGKIFGPITPPDRVYPIFRGFICFFSPNPFVVAMLRRTCGPKVFYAEVHLVRRIYVPKIPYSERTTNIWILCYEGSLVRSFSSPKGLCSEDSIFWKSPPHYTGSILRRFFNPKFL